MGAAATTNTTIRDALARRESRDAWLYGPPATPDEQRALKELLFEQTELFRAPQPGMPARISTKRLFSRLQGLITDDQTPELVTDSARWLLLLAAMNKTGRVKSLPVVVRDVEQRHLITLTGERIPVITVDRAVNITVNPVQSRKLGALPAMRVTVDHAVNITVKPVQSRKLGTLPAMRISVAPECLLLEQLTHNPEWAGITALGG